MQRKMKNSGINWIGEIPVRWNIIRTKNVFRNVKRIVGDKHSATERLALTLNGVIKRGKNEADGLQPEKFDTYQFLYKNELVFKLIDLANIATSRVGLSPFDGMVSPAYIILHNESLDNRFYYYYYLSMWHRNIFNSLGDNGVRSSLNASDLLNIPTVCLSETEKTKIANYLDGKCAQIDSLIAHEEATIEELKTYKQSVITEAVTKGLDKSAPMKDSGIEWIGDIPQNWEVKRAKFIASAIFKGHGITKEDIVIDGDTPCVRYGEIYSKYDISFEECKTKTNKANLTALQYFHHGDILFAGTGELVEEIGKNIVYLGEQECLAGGDIIVFRHAQNPVFLNYALYAESSQVQKSHSKAKLKVVHISASELGNIFVALPSIEEQNRIAEYLDKRCADIDNLIAIKQQKIEELKEYKKSLIYEYVTGKKEVA